MEDLSKKLKTHKPPIRIGISHTEVIDQYPYTVSEVKRITGMFAKEFYENNANNSEKSLLKKIKMRFDAHLNKDALAEETYIAILDALDENQDARIFKESSRNTSNSNLRVYLVRDLDDNNALIGFAIAEIGNNYYKIETDDGTSEEVISDTTEDKDVKVGTKISAYILPKYRTIDDSIINGKYQPPRIAIGLNNIIDEWFKNEGVKFQYATTGKRMNRNIMAYIANGFFIQEVEKDFVTLKKDEEKPINHKQRVYLVQGVKKGSFFLADHAEEIPESKYERIGIRESKFDEELRVDKTTIERTMQVGKDAQDGTKNGYQVKKENDQIK